jgi:hypothetical protein
MNYFQARQRKESKRWDFTCKNDGRIWPVGYCAGKKIGESADPPTSDKYHDDGHETEAEARECYKQYVLDNELHFDAREDSRSMHVCAYPGCDEFTKGIATLGCARMWPLCDEHRNKEAVSELYTAPSQIISS